MNSTVDREILEYEERLTTATRQVDVDALDRIYADDIIFTGVTGVVCDKRSIMDEARRGLAERQRAATSAAASVVSYEKEDIRAVRHDGTAVTSFTFAVTIRGDGNEVTRRYRTTNVWMKRTADWQVVAAHTAVMA